MLRLFKAVKSFDSKSKSNISFDTNGLSKYSNKVGLSGCLRAFAKDVSGNTLAMVAAGLVPMAGIIGSGVDLSRAYMAKTRLQQACDAGVLAGRSAMAEGTFDSNAQSQTNNFFNINFPANYLNTTNRTFTPVSPSGTSAVSAVASVTLPTVIMKIFGNDNFEISVECAAILEIANSDVTMILDTTGSMSYDIDDGTGNGTTTTRLAALRAATKSFYDIVSDAANGTGARIRYAMVPYSGTVNVGKAVYDLDPAYLIGDSAGDTYDYQSRRAWYEYQDTETIVTPAGTVTNTYYETINYITDSDCTRFGNNQDDILVYVENRSRRGVSYSYDRTWEPSDSGYSEGQSASLSGDPGGIYTFSRYDFRNPFTCRRLVTRATNAETSQTQTVTRYTLDSTEPGATFAYWEHTQLSHNVYDFVRSIETSSGGGYANSAAAIPTERDGSTTRWAGCIMERDTVADNDVAYSGLTGTITPSGAKDLDIDVVPNSDATRWRPYWPEVSFSRDTGVSTQNFSNTDSDKFVWISGGGKSQVACPSPAQLFSEMTKSQFDTYVDALIADGGTYHDLGMLWGARISSPDGIFSTNVTETPANNGFVSRHLIFMTDGTLDIGEEYYSAYGLERHDQLIGNGSEATASQNHIERFQALCEAVRAKGIRLWVVAFATSLTTEMTNCASPNSSYTSSNASQLNTVFTTIAATVADLRLSK